MTLDTESTLYVCTDRNNAVVRMLIPYKLMTAGIKIVELNLSDPDPESTDRAEHKLLTQIMDEYRFEV